MVQLTFLAMLPFVLPALGANIKARNNWGSTIAATPVPVTSTVFASPAFPTGVISSRAASPAFPPGVTSSVSAVPVPTSFFNCGGSNFTISSSLGGVPTGVTTVTASFPGGTASSSFIVPVPVASSSIAAVPAVSSRLAERDNWGASSVFATPSSVFISDIGATASSIFISEAFPSSSFIGIGTPSSVLIPGGTASSALVCPFPTTTAYVSGTVSGATASGTGSVPSGAQLGQLGDNGSAAGMTVGAGSFVMGALAIVAHFL